MQDEKREDNIVLVHPKSTVGLSSADNCKSEKVDALLSFGQLVKAAVVRTAWLACDEAVHTWIVVSAEVDFPLRNLSFHLAQFY